MNFEESDLIPTQEIEFWGYKFDLRVGLVFPTQKKIDRLLKKTVYVSPVPDSQAWETDALNISWEGLDGYVFCLVALIPQVIQKMTIYRLQNHHDCTRVAKDVMVFGSGGSVYKTPSKTSLVGESVDSNIQQQTSQQSSLPESSCLASGVSHEYSGRFSEEVAECIKEPQRHSSRRIYESRWSILGKWCEESQVDISDPTIPDLANFLNHLFKEKISSHLLLLVTEQQLQMGWV